jgi:DNA-binding LacI/PurR family transcriptional regulator
VRALVDASSRKAAVAAAAGTLLWVKVVTAVLCINGTSTLGVMAACRRSGPAIGQIGEVGAIRYMRCSDTKA